MLSEAERRLAWEGILELRYLDAVVAGRVDSLDLLLWIVLCALTAHREASAVRPRYIEPWWL